MDRFLLPMDRSSRSKTRAQPAKTKGGTSKMATSPASSRAASPSPSDMGSMDYGDDFEPQRLDYSRLVEAVAKSIAPKVQEAIIATIQSTLASLQQAVSQHSEQMQTVEERVLREEEQGEKTDSRLGTLEAECRRLSDKVEDLENRLRRRNLRVVGLPETVPRRDLVYICEAELPKALGLPRPCKVERAHRLGLDLHQGPTDNLQPALSHRNKPRQVILKYLDFTDKVAILQAFRQRRDPLVFDGAMLLLFGDFSAEVSRKR
ncbi:uncharacterized protein LOC130357385 [Hyla sarda]|uniref:uncharacterized protein LOC130357385 n=1 Tax=Hyla sarda TaxID=327740 RepID=UPI0024C41E77|nr:uncharacterized protein LOC130357385 [Hyla sarda]